MMDAEKAREIIDKNQLIPRELSKKLIKTLVRGGDIDLDILKKYEICPDRYTAVKTEIERRTRTTSKEICRPRNKVIYEIISENYPQFEWKLDADVKVLPPKIDRIRPSLSSLLFNKVSHNAGSTKMHSHYHAANRLPTDVATDLDSLFEEIHMVRCSQRDMSNLVEYINDGITKIPFNILIPICPDYSHIKIGPGNRYKYTFTSLGNGIGVVASHAINIVHLLHNFLSKNNISAHITLVSGDFEALSRDNCHRLGITKAEFMDRVRESSKRIGEELPYRHVRSKVFADFIHLEKEWLNLCQKYEDILSQKEGPERDRYKDILVSRRPMYETWYPNLGTDEYMDLLLSQGAEYAAMGEIFERNFDRPVVLGVDHFVMRDFYLASTAMPVIYTKKIYD